MKVEVDVSGDRSFGTFFLPGPTEVRREVMEAMLAPMIPHRGRAFEELFARVQAGLRVVFGTERPVLVSTSSASGLMEAAVRCAPDGRILSLVNGAFSARFAAIARACGREVDELAVPWGATFDLDDVRRVLGAGRFVALTVVHSETSTGVLSDVRSIAALAREHGAAALVDSVSGVGGAPLRADEWGLDFVLTGSQKALAIPPGLAFGVASAEYVRRARDVAGRGLYLDVVEMEAMAARNQTPTTPALPQLFALDRQLESIVAAGIETRWREHAAMAESTWRWARATGERLGADVGVLAPEGACSPTVTAITLPAGVAAPDVVRAVAARGFVVGGGYGKLRDATFRIGHMGDHTVETVNRCLAVCGEALREVSGVS